MRIVVDVKGMRAWMEELGESGFVENEADGFLMLRFGKAVVAVELDGFESEGGLRFLEFRGGGERNDWKMMFYGKDILMGVKSGERGVEVERL